MPLSEALFPTGVSTSCVWEIWFAEPNGKATILSTVQFWLLTLRNDILSPVSIKGGHYERHRVHDTRKTKLVILPSLGSRVVHSTARRTPIDIVLAKIVRTAREGRSNVQAPVIAAVRDGDARPLPVEDNT